MKWQFMLICLMIQGPLLVTVAPVDAQTEEIRIVSDSSWKYDENPDPDWQLIDFDDSLWPTTIAPTLGLCGEAPPSCGWDESLAQHMWGQTPTDHQVLYFRKIFNIADASRVLSAALRTSSDDDHDVYVNGELIGSDWDGVAGPTLHNDVLPYLLDGQNIIAIQASDTFGGCQSMCDDGSADAKCDYLCQGSGRW